MDVLHGVVGRTVLFGILLATTEAPGLATETAESSAGDYQVQILTSLTGPGSAWGIAAYGGYATVFDVVNASGGIAGHKIAYKVLDDQSKDTQAGAVVRQAISARPVAIMDGSTSRFLAAHVPLYEQAKIPVFSQAAVAFGLKPWLYAGTTTTYQYAASLVTATEAALGGSLASKNIAYVGYNSNASVGAAKIIEGLVEKAGGKVTSVQYVEVGASASFDSGAANVIESKADALINGTTSADAIVQAKALKGQGYNGAMVLNYASASDDALREIAKTGINVFAQYIAPIAYPTTEMYAAAKKYNHEDATKTANQQEFARAWGLAYMLVKALEKCGYPCDDPAELQAAADGLGEFSVPGDSQFGPYRVSASVHHILTKFRLYKWDESTQAATPVGDSLPLQPPNY